MLFNIRLLNVYLDLVLRVRVRLARIHYDLCWGIIPMNTAYFIPDPPLVFCGGCATTENNSWIRFVASATTVSFFYNVFSCANNQGLQAAIFLALGGDCNNLVELACFSSGGHMSNIFIEANVVPGQTYLLMTDGWAGDICGFNLTASGVSYDWSAPTPLINGPLSVCQGTQTSYNVVNPSPDADYCWSVNSTTHFGDTFEFNFPESQPTVEICVTATFYCQSESTCIVVNVETGAHCRYSNARSMLR